MVLVLLYTMHAFTLYLFGTLHNCVIFFTYFLDFKYFLIKIKLKLFKKTLRVWRISIRVSVGY